MKIFSIIFAVIALVQITCLLIMQYQGHKINWAILPFVFGAIFIAGYARLSMVKSAKELRKLKG